VFAALVSSSLYRAYRLIRELQGELNSCMTESFGGLKSIHLFNREEKQSEIVSVISSRLAKARFRPILLFGILHAAMTLVVGGSKITLISFGGERVGAG